MNDQTHSDQSYSLPFATEDIVRMLAILSGLVGPENGSCSFDHHGNCQEHGWFGEQPGECGTREARELLGMEPGGYHDDKWLVARCSS